MQEESFEKEIKNNIKTLQRCEWVKEEFNKGDFKDQRLFQRLLIVAKDLASNPIAPISQASEEWKGVKAAYRFFDNEKVTHRAILSPHIQRTKKRLMEHEGVVLAIQDTTFLNYSHMKTSNDLGPIGENKAHSMGLIMHSCLAVTEQGLPLGILHEDIWARQAGCGEGRHTKPIQQKESNKWLKALQELNDISKKDVIGVCDREADIYELFVEANKLNQKILVRAQHDRSLEDGSKLWESFDSLQPAYQEVIVLPNTKNDTATVEVKFRKISLSFPLRHKNFNNLPEKIDDIYAVYLSEKNPPSHRQQLSWMLLTNYKVNTDKKARNTIQWYKERWKIEIFHKIMKSGCSVELTRLEKNSRRLPFIALKTIIAFRLLLITHYNKILPSQPASSILTQAECDALYTIKFGKVARYQDFNAKKAICWIAELGGYLSRRSDPLPGPLHVWRGWNRLQDYTKMFCLHHF